MLKIKKLTSFCNSVSIKLIQLDSFPKALEIVSRGISSSRLISQKNQSIKLWPGRILSYSVQSYILYKLEKYTESLKSLYESQLLLQTSKESLGPFSLELYLLTNFLTFMSLWKINRQQESNKYLEIVKINVSSIMKGKISTKFPKVSMDNFYGLLSFALALNRVALEGNYKEAKSLSEVALAELGEEVMSRSLINSVLMSIKKLEKNPYAIVDCDLSKEFDEIFFISVFLPMMSPNVPSIQLSPSKKSLLKRNVRNFSKRSSSGSSTVQEPKTKNSSFQYSPSSRPRSSLRAESPSLTLMRPRSSSGNHIKRKINKIYIS
jgi:hypothetical protein